MNERTPLIQTVIVTRREPRYPHSTLRRFCTICLGSLLILLLIGFLIPLTIFPFRHHRHHFHSPHFHSPHFHSPHLHSPHFHSPHFHNPHNHWDLFSLSSPKQQTINYEELQEIILSTPEEAFVRSWNEYYTSGPHLAGKNLSQALWTRERWQEYGVKTEVIAYDVYLNYPVDHRLALLKDEKVEYECSLEEDVLEEDSTTGLVDRIPTFHGYSATGNVTGQYVYINYGTKSDFEDLVKANISLKGKVALAKYGRGFRGIKTQLAQEHEMLGIVMYSDPQDDGEVTELNGYKPYPEGPARNPSSVQRGSTMFLSKMPGDPTTPGYPSKPGVPRADPKLTIPSIPSLPISYQDALPLLKALNGHGPNASSFNENWEGGGLAYKGVQYNIGPSPESLTLNLFNEQEYVTTPIWNAIGIINGTIPDEVIVVGNHRDAWIAGGASDPHAGSAALMEIVRSFGVALAAGWKPLRTIVFASWDGEEYALLGSTEWVEEYLPWLSSSAVAYLNIDVGVKGTKFEIASVPSLLALLQNVTAVVPSPKGGSVLDHWDHVNEPIGSGSDFCAFLDYAGIPSIDLWYGPTPQDPVYHYHSNYDSFHWMDTLGDPTWQYHTAITKVLGLLAAKLADAPVIPLNATDYSTSLKQYLDDVKKEAGKSSISEAFNFESLDSATTRLHTASKIFDAHAAVLSLQMQETIPWWQFWKRLQLLYAVRTANTKYKTLEREFLYPEGLDDRPWFKHIVFAPGRWTGYSGATYPGLIESFEDGNLTNAMKWSRIIEERLNSAASLLAV